METGEETYVKLRLHHTGSKNQERSIRRLQIDQPSISVRDLRILVANMLDDYAQFGGYNGLMLPGFNPNTTETEQWEPPS